MRLPRSSGRGLAPFVTAGLLLTLCSLGEAKAAEAEATFSRNVAPILFEHCGDCHRDGGMAPMSLLSYRSARPWARAIGREVESRRMPPFHARGGDFAVRNDISLSQEQIDIVLAWISAGAPEGDAAELPAVPDYAARAAAKPEPDLFLAFDGDFAVPAGADTQRAFVVRNESERDLWINGIDFEPDLSPVVHHMFAFTDPTGLGWRFQDADPQPGFVGSVDGGEGTERMMEVLSSGGGGFGGWAPGAGVVRYGDGIGQLLPAATDIILQYHYWNDSDRAITHRPRIGVYLLDDPAEHILQFAGPSANQRLAIMPGDARSTHLGDWTADEDLLLIGVMPHMHFLGASMRLTLHRPGSSEPLTLIDVPRYDFAWQTVYQYREPIAISAGDRVEMVAVLDNSEANPHNPSSPPRLVYFGERSDDEMADGALFVARKRRRGVEDTPKMLGEERALLQTAGGPMDAVTYFGAGGEPGFGLLEHDLGKGYFYYGDPDGEGPVAGVFREDPLSTQLEPFPFSELIYILEGSLSLTDAAGRQELFGPGDCVLVPRGVPVRWHHEGPLHKVFAVFDNGDASRPIAGHDSYLRIDVPPPSVAGNGERSAVYASDSGSAAGVHRRPAGSTEPIHWPNDELLVLIDGSAVLTDAAGRRGRVGAGDVFMITAGTQVGWEQAEPLQMVYLAFGGGQESPSGKGTASGGR